MKTIVKKRVRKVVLAAAAALLLTGCNTQDGAALKNYQREAIQTKLAQMSPDDAEAYIRAKMDGVHMSHCEAVPTMMPNPNGGVSLRLMHKRVEDGLYVDFWAEHDTNGTLLDEYIDYAMDNYAVEADTKAEAKAEFKRLQKETQSQNVTAEREM